jgi:acyl phosphate:glycerol-3-phosphate acyltransferase
MIKPVDVLIFVAAYLQGSIPFSVIVSRVFYKTDIRQFGSGNPGATNTLRTLGPKAGLSVLALDILKGLAAVLIAKYCGLWTDLTVSDRMTIAGACAITGHVFSPFLGFKGGKGFATSMGVILALEPFFAIAVISIFILILWMSRFVSLSSICASFAFTILTLLLRNSQYIEVIFSICITLMITLKHKDNIIRLLKGEENKFSIGRKNSK